MKGSFEGGGEPVSVQSLCLAAKEQIALAEISLGFFLVENSPLAQRWREKFGDVTRHLLEARTHLATAIAQQDIFRALGKEVGAGMHGPEDDVEITLPEHGPKTAPGEDRA